MTKRESIVSGLRQAADFIEMLDESIPAPELAVLAVNSGFVPDATGHHHSLDSVTGMAMVAAGIGTCDKEVNDMFFKLVKMFGPVRIEWVAWRNAVCEPVVVGKRTVPAQPATDAYEVDVVEYKCPSLLRALPRGGSVETPIAELPQSKPAPLMLEAELEEMPF